MSKTVSDVQMVKYARPMGREDSHEALNRGTGTREQRVYAVLERVKSRGRRDVFYRTRVSQLPD